MFSQNVNNLIAQNAYVFILATGMLFCILTGGNIDLSVGSVVCFVAPSEADDGVEWHQSPTLHLSSWSSWECWWGHGRDSGLPMSGFLLYRYPLAGMLMFRGAFQCGAAGNDAGPPYRTSS